jgi:hypothetical protein
MSGSATRNGPGDWRDIQKPEARSLAGRIRRMAIGVTSRMLWQLLGHRGLDGKVETRDAEVFGAAGIFGRPGGRNSEAIVIFPGEGAMSPIVVAVRDEQMRAAVVAAISGGIATGETAIASGTNGTVSAMVHVRANGTVEVRAPGGAAVALATQASVDAFRVSYNTHTHSVPGGGGVGTVQATAVPVAPIVTAIAGTTVLKGQ